jgi:ATP-dependent helicase/nuclease subunit B
MSARRPRCLWSRRNWAVPDTADRASTPSVEGSGRRVVFTIPAHRSFADALAKGLIARFGGRDDGIALARGLVLLPNNRARRAVQEAFIRESGGGLLLPRLIALGDIDQGEALGAALDPIDDDTPVPPAIDPARRHMILARLIQHERGRDGAPLDAGEALRLAIALAQTLDQLIVERRSAHDLAALAQETDQLSAHWERALNVFKVLLEQWPQELARIGCIDVATRRDLLLDRLGRRWRQSPPDRFVVAAGVLTAAPAIAALLRTIAGLPNGMVVLPDLDKQLDGEAWRLIGGTQAEETAARAEGRRPVASATHPQHVLRRLLDRMGVHPDEVALWRWGGGHDAAAKRSKAISQAMLPPLLTGRWPAIKPADRSLAGVRALEAIGPAEEAQAIAIALREVVETPGRTAALVTPDRGLARRVSAHLRRWGIEADDSAGRPLSLLPPGTLLLGLAQTMADRFAPVALLSLLKHPLVHAGSERLAWLDQVRQLDLLLRGPRPAAGLVGITARINTPPERLRDIAAPLQSWWPPVAAMLAPLETLAEGEQPLPQFFAAVRDAAGTLSGDAVWVGHQGHQAALTLAELEAAAPDGPPTAQASGFAAMLSQMLGCVAVRPPQGGHPRIAILGLIEAQLQQRDLMILAGLNEGVWPPLPAPDPWLAPRIRQLLGLPGLEDRIGLSAHDLANGLGAPQVLLSRAKRDATAPTVASRFWLRLQAMAGPRWVEDASLIAHARLIDDPPGPPQHQPEPAPCPPAALRPKRIAVTHVDRLMADPYAFYAARVLRLSALDPVDAEPSAAWRGTAIHAVLEHWTREASGDPARLLALGEELLGESGTTPLLRALWRPRLMAGLRWTADRVLSQQAEGRTFLFGEKWGSIERGGITLGGMPDRVDSLGGGRYAIVDYKSGSEPSNAQVGAGYALQLGLLGLIAREGGFEALPAGGIFEDFEYWAVLKKTGDGRFGACRTVTAPGGGPHKQVAENFVDLTAAKFDEAADKYLRGSAPFSARPHPDAPVYGDYDQLMRLDEWYGRGAAPTPLAGKDHHGGD